MLNLCFQGFVGLTSGKSSCIIWLFKWMMMSVYHLRWQVKAMSMSLDLHSA